MTIGLRKGIPERIAKRERDLARGIRELADACLEGH
jgi:hypothetical protein